MKDFYKVETLASAEKIQAEATAKGLQSCSIWSPCTDGINLGNYMIHVWAGKPADDTGVSEEAARLLSLV